MNVGAIPARGTIMKKLTCSYGRTCSLSMVDHGGIPLMLFDMAIDEYVIHLGMDRGEYKFAGNVVLNDKLYFTREQTDNILKILDVFIKTTYLDDPDAEKTQRGFKFVNPVDAYGNTLSVQESSNVDPAIWFGVVIEPEDVKVWCQNRLISYAYPSAHVLIHDRLHLKMPQAKKLRKIIAGLWENA